MPEICEDHLEACIANNEEAIPPWWIGSDRRIRWNVDVGTSAGSMSLTIDLDEECRMRIMTWWGDPLLPDDFPAIYAYFKKTIGEVEKDSNGFPIAITY